MIAAGAARLAPTARLLRAPLDSTLSPVEALLALRDEPRLFGLIGVWGDSAALVGSRPLLVPSPDADPFALLDELPALEDAGAEAAEAGCVGGGWFGALGYRLAGLVERLPAPPPRPQPRPQFDLAFHDHVLRLDRDGQWWFEALWTPERDGALAGRRAELAARLAAPAPAPRPYACGRFGIAPGRAGHAEAVRICQWHIAEGDVYQANLCVRAEASFAGDPLDAFAAALDHVRPPYAAYVADRTGATLSLSPELFLRRTGRQVLTAPIKGTARRDADPAVAEEQRRRLLASEKDRAENVMIVDLMRNDLSRVCRPGSVCVRSLAAAEAHPGVWHLVSYVEGEQTGSDAELLRATFPPGSITGAPKVRALELIHALESTARETYTGAIGYASPLAGLELNVAIRTFEMARERIWLGVGGGVVADSDPEGEFEECLLKAEALVAALGSGVDEPLPLERPGPSRHVPNLVLDVAPRAAGRRGHVQAVEPAIPLPKPPHGALGYGTRPLEPRPQPGTGRGSTGQAVPLVTLPRPEPARGVLATVLVLDRRPVELERHLARLGASTVALYGAELPATLPVEIAEICASADTGASRLRVLVTPAEPLRVELELEPAPGSIATPADGDVVLEPLALPGGLGPHKWIDRRIVESVGPDRIALVCDLAGEVLEAGRANVALVEGAALVTPPADGRILAGTARARVLEIAASAGLDAREERLSLDRLLAADAVLLTSSIAGIRGVATCGKQELRRAPEPVETLRRLLRTAWL